MLRSSPILSFGLFILSGVGSASLTRAQDVVLGEMPGGTTSGICCPDIAPPVAATFCIAYDSNAGSVGDPLPLTPPGGVGCEAIHEEGQTYRYDSGFAGFTDFTNQLTDDVDDPLLWTCVRSLDSENKMTVPGSCGGGPESGRIPGMMGERVDYIELVVNSVEVSGVSGGSMSSVTDVTWRFLRNALRVTRFDDPVPNGCTPTDCSLREATIAANTTPGPDSIFLEAGTYVLTQVGAGPEAGDLDLSDTVEILGVGSWATIIDANGIDRALDLQSGSGSITIADVRITGGFEDAGHGGGIEVESGVQLRLDRVDLFDNQVTGAGNLGGGLANFGETTITDSSVRDNIATPDGDGGGISNSGPLTILRSTVSGNQGRWGGGIKNNHTASLSNATLSGNSATSGGGGVVATGPLTLSHSTLSGNTAAFGTAICTQFSGHTLEGTLIDGDCLCAPSGAVWTSLGGNLESPGNTCALTGPGDQVNVSNALLALGPLAPNGGPTATHPLLSGSPAVNAGPRSCPSEDQRGSRRAFGGGCDVGAFELPWCSVVGGTAIPDNDPAGLIDSLVITDGYSLSDLDVYVDLDHEFVADLTLSLEHVGTGTTVTLVDQPDQGKLQPCSGNDMRVLLDDEATASIEYDCVSAGDGPAFPLGRYVPGDPGGPVLDAFEGESLNGEWRLKVVDNSTADTGVLNQWCLIPDPRIFADDFEEDSLNTWTLSVGQCRGPRSNCRTREDELLVIEVEAP